MRLWNSPILPLSLALLSGCAVGPDYRSPAIATPAVYSAIPVSVGENKTTRTDLFAWWARFKDPELSSLIARALNGNLDLMTSRSRIRESREQVVIAGAASLPELGTDANVDHAHLSQNSGLSELSSLFGGGGQAGGGNTFALPDAGTTTYTVGFDASWEIDVFGGTRRSIEAAEASAEQAVWTARDSEVTVAAEVANDYLMLRSLQRQVMVAQAEVARQRQTLAVLQARRRFGLITALDVHEQRTQLFASLASLPDLDAQERIETHSLGVLVGEPPESLEQELTPTEILPPPPPLVPLGLPSDLLRRRPDIRAAERAVATSNAEVGVAVADLYPKFDLTGAFDFVSLNLNNLLDLSSRQYNGGAAVSWPIFEGGQIRAHIRATKEENLQALYAYRTTVLRALQETEDALTRYGDEPKKNHALRDTLASAQNAEATALAEYKAGLTDFLPVLSAQAAILNTQTELAQSDAAIDHDIVSLYKALGGGWQLGESGRL